MKPLFVFLEGFCFPNVEYRSSSLFFQVLLTLWSRTMQSEFGIKAWPDVGIIGDRKLISQFTDKSMENLGGFPVNSSDCMVLDQSVNNTWKNDEGDLYSTFKPSRKTNSGFINDMEKTRNELEQDVIRNAIDLQPKIMQPIVAAKIGTTSYMNSGFAKA